MRPLIDEKHRCALSKMSGRQSCAHADGVTHAMTTRHGIARRADTTCRHQRSTAR
jgi:hypothetical protein